MKRWCLLLLLILWTACGGVDQLHGMYELEFSSTAVCNTQEKAIEFRNVSGEEIVIDGAAISGGTDPDGNFTLKAIRVGDQETEAVFGILNDVHIPAGSIYTFVMTYTPQTRDSFHSAIIDIAYRAPQSGIVQITLTGNSPVHSNCASAQPAGSGGSSTGGSTDSTGTTCASDASCGTGKVCQGGACVDAPAACTDPIQSCLTGEMTLTIERMVLVSGSLPLPITTDANATATPYVPVTLPVSLNATLDQLTLPAIDLDPHFLLPPTTSAPLNTLITGNTEVTSRASIVGMYLEDGNVILEKVPVHLKELSPPERFFEADFDVTLTTSSVTIPADLSEKVRRAGFSLTSANKKIQGSPINFQTLQMTLVGIDKFANPGGVGDVADNIGGKSGAVLIQAKINRPVTP